MSRFVWEPPTRLVLGEGPAPPRTARDLLADLGVKDASAEAQREAVYGWLLTPAGADDLMYTSLRRKGLPASPVDAVESKAEALSVVPGTATVVGVGAWAQSAFVFPKRLAGFRTDVVVVVERDMDAVVWGGVGALANERQPERKFAGELVR